MLPAAMAAGKHLGCYGDTLLNPLIERARFQPQNQGDCGLCNLRLLPRCHTFQRRWKTQAALLTMHNRADRYISTNTTLGDADIGAGHAHEKRLAKSGQSIEDSMAGDGGWSGNRAGAFWCARSERATVVVASSPGAAGERASRFQSTPTGRLLA